jgi:hypothetical protein
LRFPVRHGSGYFAYVITTAILHFDQGAYEDPLARAFGPNREDAAS